MKDNQHPGILEMIKTRKAQVKAEKRIIQDNSPQLWIVPLMLYFPYHCI